MGISSVGGAIDESVCSDSKDGPPSPGVTGRPPGMLDEGGGGFLRWEEPSCGLAGMVGRVVIIGNQPAVTSYGVGITE